MYLSVVLVLVVLWAARRRGHDAGLGPLSPGLMAPLGLIFGLLVGFLVADVWADRARAASAVSQEASALRDVDLLAGAFPAMQPQVRGLLRDQIDDHVAADVGRSGHSGGRPHAARPRAWCWAYRSPPTVSASRRASSSWRSTGRWRRAGRAWR